MEITDILEKFGIPVATGVAGWWAGRPKTKVEIEATNIDSAGKVIDKWAGYTERLESNIGKLSDIIDDLKDALKLAKDDNLACKGSLFRLQAEYDSLLKLYNELNEELRQIKGADIINIDINPINEQ